MPPSKVRKEEAELRKIAKKARDTRKEVKAREKKQQQRLAKSEDATATKPADATTPRKRQAAMILPDEITELRDRLGLSGASPDKTSTRSGTPSPKKGAAGKKAAGKAAAAAAAAAGPSPKALPEPPYHLEVHFRRKELLVDVTLHKIPESKIDISETNASRLVVDTSKHTKQWRLELPYPEGVVVDAEAGSYELENGVLRCRLPLTGDIPAHLQEKWDAVIEKMREQRAMRFHVTRDGALTVRTRRALLAKDGDATAAGKKPVAEAETEPVPDTEQVKKAPQKRGRAAEATSASDTAAAPSKGPNEVSAPATKRAKQDLKSATKPAAPAKKAEKTDVFKQDHQRALEIAKAAAAQSKASIRERVQQALETQKKRQAKMDTREVRKEQKLQRRQQSFAKVLQQQKEQLLAQAAMVEATLAKPAAAKKASGKSVSFAG